MTSQVPDSFEYLGHRHVVVACLDGAPFLARNAGFETVGTTTACQRGHACGYELSGQRLQLRELWVSHEPAATPAGQAQLPDLNGVKATIRHPRRNARH